MTSKISYFKLWKDDIKRRSWLLAINSLLLFLILPVGCLMGVNQKLRQMEESGGLVTMDDVLKYYAGNIGASNGMLIAGLILCAILCAVSGYLYLHSKEKLDFYHSIPIRREKLFLVQFLSGLFLFAVPYLVNFVICLVIGLIKGVLTGGILFSSIGIVFIHILFFLLIYGVAIIPVMMTGKLIVGILGIGVFYVYGPLIDTLNTMLGQTFFMTYFNGGSMNSWVTTYTSPIGIYMKAINSLNSGKIPWLVLVLSFILLAAVIFVNLWIYRIRSSEAAESAMAFPKTEAVIKILLVIPVSVGAGLFFRSINGSDSDGWFVFGLLFCAIVMGVIVEFIYHMDFKAIFKKRISVIISLVAILVIAAVYRFDLLGYDTKLPSESKISAMGIYVNGLNEDYIYPNGCDMNTTMRVLDATEIENYDSIYELAKSGIEYTKANGKTIRAGYTNGKNVTLSYSDVSIKYQLANGKSFYRQYHVDTKKLEEIMVNVYGDPTYVEKLYPINYLDLDTVKRIKVQDFRQRETILDLTRDQIRELLTIYQEEMNKINYKELVQGLVPVTMVLSEEISEPYRVNEIDNFKIYPSFTKTLEYLKNVGYEFKTSVDLKDISKIQISDYQEAYNNGYETESNNYEFTQEEDQKAIIDSLSFGKSYNVNYNLEVRIIWKDSGNGGDSIYYFKADSIPDCVNNAIKMK